jgi:hypothetical protein
LNNVQPHFVAHPLEGLSLHIIDIERRSTSQENRDISTFEVTCRNQDSQRDKEDKRQLILFI